MISFRRDNEESILLGDNLVVWRACLTVAHAVATLSCIFRLHRRKTTGQFWLDDWFAAGAFVMECAFFPTLWLRGVSSRSTLIVTSWMAQLFFIPLIWCTRISLAFSIARVIPPQQKTRRASLYLVYLFGAVCVIFILQTAIYCGHTHASWTEIAPYQCPMSSSAAISRITLDCLSDISLIVVPFCAFWRRLKLPTITRRLIKACLCASLLTTICSILIAGILFSHENSKSPSQREETSFMASVMSHLMATTSLLVCNTLVVVTSFYRFFRPTDGPKKNEAPQQPPPSHDVAISAESDHETPSNTDSTSKNPSQSQAGPSEIIGSALDLSSGPSSYYIELTELFESDLIHHSSPSNWPQAHD